MSKIDLNVMPKVDLTLLNKLVKEVATQNEVAEKVLALATENKQDHVVELAKALGVVSAIKIEAEMLMADYTKLIKNNTMFASANGNEIDLLSSLFGDLPKVPKN